jgi:DNA primase
VPKIKEEDIDALREQADIVEILSSYSNLKRSGGHTFKGLCPFHSEKTPSFTVDSAKGLWHCFGCGEGGNVYHFVQKIETLSFPEAVEWLARKSGFNLRYEEARPGDARASGVKARLVEANTAAARFFHESLMSSPDAAAARGYLSGRDFGADVAQRWQLGWAPGRDALCRHLLSRGFSPAEIMQADLGRKSDRDGSLYDSFRSRIIFPTKNLQGDVVGFGARAMGDVQPKYLNTAETPVFSKSRVMYGLDRAKSAIARGVAVVVEGYTDVIALHEAGISEAVATNGVALGETHFELLKRFSDRAVLMFDADLAGKSAADRSFGMHARLGIEVLVAPLPPGRDPADVAKEDGPDAIRKVIHSAQPLIEFKLEQTITHLPLDTPEARSKAVRAAAEVLIWQRDVIARHEYAFIAAKWIGVDSEVVQRAIEEASSRTSGVTGETAERGRDRRLPGHVKVEREALTLLLTYPREAASFARQASEESFTSPARREVFRHALEMTRDTRANFAGAAQQMTPAAAELFTELSVEAVNTDGARVEAGRIAEVFTRLKIFALERLIKGRRNTLQDVNPVNDPGRHDQLFTELVGLEAERRDLLRGLQGGG